MKKVSVIITAGGIGKRMGVDLPKQFLLLGNEPILMHTIQNFALFDSQCEIILALPPEWISYWNDLVVKYQFKVKHKIIEGGAERFHTVKNALGHCSNEYIAVHDAVRPFVAHTVLKSLWDHTFTGKSVIPVIDLKDSLRKIEHETSRAVDRSAYKLVQTPQLFPKETLVRAYTQDFKKTFTDDASVVEELGTTINTIQGNSENIKITNQLDLLLAEVILKQRNS